MKLRLISAHPDRASGLKFLNSELFAFMPLAFTLGVIAAGSVVNRVVYYGVSWGDIQKTIIGLLIVVLVLFVGPLLIFSFNLHLEKVSGIFRYGQLADALGREFERKWLENSEKVNEGALEATDFSATTDLYQIVSNVYQMAIVPFELRTLISLFVSTLLPFVPVLVMTVPFNVIVKDLLSLLF
jgi:hypothetical protein